MVSENSISDTVREEEERFSHLSIPFMKAWSSYSGLQHVTAIEKTKSEEAERERIDDRTETRGEQEVEIHFRLWCYCDAFFLESSDTIKVTTSKLRSNQTIYECSLRSVLHTLQKAECSKKINYREFFALQFRTIENLD